MNVASACSAEDPHKYDSVPRYTCFGWQEGLELFDQLYMGWSLYSRTRSNCYGRACWDVREPRAMEGLDFASLKDEHTWRQTVTLVQSHHEVGCRD
jgi:hypothetical protein